MGFKANILMTENISHDVKRIILSRPHGLQFEAGQGLELAINTPEWREQGRPFTPTSLHDDGVMEFIIKAYPEHHGVTEKLHTLKSGDDLLLSEPFGTITYQGPGTFIAAGAGITPFLAIMRQLEADNRLAGHSLLYSNKTPADIIEESRLRHLFGDRGKFFCSRESDCRCRAGRIDLALLKQSITNINQQFYVCGPPPFVKSVSEALGKLGVSAEAVIFEK